MPQRTSDSELSSSPPSPALPSSVDENLDKKNGAQVSSPSSHNLFCTFSGNSFIILGSVVLGFFASFLGWLPPRGAWMQWLAKAWGQGLLTASGCRLDIEGEGALEPGQSYVFMANHQSLYDVAALLVALPGNRLFLAKKSLFRIPFFGWSLAAGGFVPVDREDRSSAKETFKISLERLQDGRSLVIFPEETRSFDGQLLPFKPGGFLLALKSGRPIVPIGLQGTLDIRRKGELSIRPQTVRVVIGQPIDPTIFGVARRRELMGAVRERIEELRTAGINPG